MVKLSINGITIETSEQTSIFEAAKSVGVEIPVMCYKPNHHNHPSCLICLVKDENTGKMLPSCAHPVENGMVILTDSPEIQEARREALELLLSDHVGDCQAPCMIACPANMDIPQMNRFIATEKLDDATNIVQQTIALPSILAYICQAPCEKACRRKQIDEAVSICILKRYSAKNYILPQIPKNNNKKKIAIIGGGVAGLSAAFYVLAAGNSCTIFEKNEKLGGLLLNVSPDILPENILTKEVEKLQKMGLLVETNTEIDTSNFKNLIETKFEATILATGTNSAESFKSIGLETENNSLKINKETLQTNIANIFACGNIVRTQQMAVRAGAQARQAALSLCFFLSGEGKADEIQKFNSSFGKLLPEEFAEYLKESHTGKRNDIKAGNLNNFSNEEAINEATRCLHCDCRKIDNCTLRNLATKYNADKKKFPITNRLSLSKYLHHKIVYEPEKCIRCGLCVEITQTECEPIGLSYVGRGFDVRIKVPFSLSINEALEKTALECANSCPTGALAIK